MLKSGQEFIHPGLGVVHLTVRRNSSSITARWRDGKVFINVPPFTSSSEVTRLLDEWTPGLLDRMPARPEFVDGQVVDFHDFDITLRHNEALGRSLRSMLAHKAVDRADKFRFIIEANLEGNIDGSAFNIPFTRLKQSIARYIVAVRIIPIAREVADYLGYEVKEWGVGRGRNRYGTCYADGRITLSQELAFSDRRRQLQTITHELAHLRHFDHSAAFHALHDSLLARVVSVDKFLV